MKTCEGVMKTRALEIVLFSTGTQDMKKRIKEKEAPDLTVGFHLARNAGFFKVDNILNITIFHEIQKTFLPKHLLLLAEKGEAAVAAFVDQVTDMLCFVLSETDDAKYHDSKEDNAELIAEERGLRKDSMESWIKILKTSKKTIIQEQAKRVREQFDALPK